MSTRLLHGDCRSLLKTLPSESVHCVVTSPPYFGLRSYGIGTENGEIGLEATPDAYVAEIVAVFREVRRVLRDDGTLWLNLGDSYAASGGPGAGGNAARMGRAYQQRNIRPNGDYAGLKPKDLIGIPWMVAFALRADGWYLRQDIIWSKPSPMPESVRDRCCKSHEYLFLLSKSSRYHFDQEAIAEPSTGRELFGNWTGKTSLNGDRNDGGRQDWTTTSTRTKRSVWEVATQPFSEAHFATFPPALIEPCILAGCPAKACAECGKPWVREVERGPGMPPIYGGKEYNGPSAHMDNVRKKSGQQWADWKAAYPDIQKGFSPSCSCNAATVPGTVLDPFAGAGTTGLVADRLGRNAVLIELNAGYADMSKRRIVDDAPLFAEVVAA